MRNFFTKEKLKAVIVLIPVVYAIMYFSILLSSSFSAAKRYVEEDSKIIGAIGPIKLAIPAFFGSSSSHVDSHGGDANHTLNVLGSEDGGKVVIRLILENQEWKVISAALITNKNRVVILKEENSNQ